MFILFHIGLCNVFLYQRNTELAVCNACFISIFAYLKILFYTGQYQCVSYVLLGRIKTDTTSTAVSTLFTWSIPRQRVNGHKVCEICEAYSKGCAMHRLWNIKTSAAIMMFLQNSWFDEIVTDCQHRRLQNSQCSRRDNSHAVYCWNCCTN